MVIFMYFNDYEQLVMKMCLLTFLWLFVDDLMMDLDGVWVEVTQSSQLHAQHPTSQNLKKNYKYTKEYY